MLSSRHADHGTADATQPRRCGGPHEKPPRAMGTPFFHTTAVWHVRRPRRRWSLPCAGLSWCTGSTTHRWGRPSQKWVWWSWWDVVRPFARGGGRRPPGGLAPCRTHAWGASRAPRRGLHHEGGHTGRPLGRYGRHGWALRGVGGAWSSWYRAALNRVRRSGLVTRVHPGAAPPSVGSQWSERASHEYGGTRIPL